MMAGTEETIEVSASSIPAVTVSSSAQNVVTVGSVIRTCCTQGSNGTCRTLGATDACDASESPTLTVTVDAHASGTSNLSLVATDGSTFDFVPLAVAEAAAVDLACDEKPGPLTLALNGSCALGWTATDASGNKLMATQGVTLLTSALIVVGFETFLSLTPVVSLQASQAFFATPTLVATGVGDATVFVIASGVSTQVGVHVD
jgi:hypothetical protein